MSFNRFCNTISCGHVELLYTFIPFYFFHTQITIIMVLSNSLLDVWKKAPSLHEIVELLADISDRWIEIGFAIRISRNVLSGLQHSHESYIVKLNHVLYTWMDTQSSPVTWETIISAIEGPIVNNKRKAEEIRQYLGEQKSNFNLHYLDYGLMFTLLFMMGQPMIG